MEIEFDPEKRRRTLEERGLDMADVVDVFEGLCYDFPDRRRDYGEDRVVTIGFLGGRMVHVTWTRRDRSRRIISFRKCNDRERETFAPIFASLR